MRNAEWKMGKGKQIVVNFSALCSVPLVLNPDSFNLNPLPYNLHRMTDHIHIEHQETL